MGEKKKSNANTTALIGAAFLMATSAIGPGFLTQTATFTGQYGSIFALAIICTILLDVTTQLNIWSIIGVSGMRGQDIANKVVPGLGYFIAFLVSLGGLVFNIGNVGGAATGFNIVFGFPLKVGTVVAGVIGILIFLSKDAKNFMDKLTKYLGSIMIVTVLYVAFRSKPPVVGNRQCWTSERIPEPGIPDYYSAWRKLRRLHHILRCTSSSGCRFLRNQGSSACSPLRINGHQRIGSYENFTVPRSFRRCYSNSGSGWKRSMGSKPASSSF